MTEKTLSLNAGSFGFKEKLEKKAVEAVVGLLGSLMAVGSVWAMPVNALQVQIKPANAQVGDTLSVMIQMDNASSEPPQVSLKGKTYPVYSTGSNRFRALLPSTPLDKPGYWQIQVKG